MMFLDLLPYLQTIHEYFIRFVWYLLQLFMGFLFIFLVCNVVVVVSLSWGDGLNRWCYFDVLAGFLFFVSLIPVVVDSNFVQFRSDLYAIKVDIVNIGVKKNIFGLDIDNCEIDALVIESMNIDFMDDRYLENEFWDFSSKEIYWLAPAVLFFEENICT